MKIDRLTDALTDETDTLSACHTSFAELSRRLCKLLLSLLYVEDATMNLNVVYKMH
jgi:acyl carrier protein phosphodiesterase